MSDRAGDRSAGSGSARLRLADGVVDRAHKRQMLVTVFRIITVTGALGVIYVLAPFDRAAEGTDLVEMVIALIGYCVIVVFQIVAVSRSSYPGLRALEAIAVTVPLLIFLFSAIYVILSTANPANFTERVDHVGGVYFTVTTFATVGFGDIAASSDTARVVVTVQMLMDLLFIGVVARVLFGTVERRRAVLDEDADPTTRTRSPADEDQR